MYTDYHTSHGSINLSKALGVSCNYFYYELGRIMGIDRINKYFKIFGMGQPTGIELAENVGVLGTAAYKQTLNIPISDRVWMPGDTLRTAIGVGYSEHTPLQISNYVSMIVNGGTRYAAHLLNHKIPATPFDSIENAVRTAIEDSRREGVPLICLGSLYLYGSIVEILERL